MSQPTVSSSAKSTSDNHALQQQLSEIILQGFEQYFSQHQIISHSASALFLRGQWQQIQLASKARLNVYEQQLASVVSHIYDKLNPVLQPNSFWIELKQGFYEVLNNHSQTELLESFYNSVIGRLFHHNKINDQLLFVLPSRCYLPGQLRENVVHTQRFDQSLNQTFDLLLKDFNFGEKWRAKSTDIQLICERLHSQIVNQASTISHIEILKPVFYRNHYACLIGRLCTEQQSQPFVIVLMLNEQGQVYLDALLCDTDSISVLFGFARSYFLMACDCPAEIVAFLHQVQPDKKHYELYSAIGFHKHSKTAFYRDFIRHLELSNDRFEQAPGIAGLVMAVFHLPSYDVVFKIIRDQFGDSKSVTREQVKHCYRTIKMHDRVGRMADTHEFNHFHLPRHRISQTLIDYLQQVASGSIRITNDEVIISHLYIERRMTPLNLYLKQDLPESKTDAVINDLGDCIKEIASADIFPGDMLHKNFGVSRHGRVIFYDYDEISLMAEKNFRPLPQTHDPFAMDTLSIGPSDVFPQQFEHFIVGQQPYKSRLKHFHPELFECEFWQQLQQKLKKGRTLSVLPYSNRYRFVSKNP